MIAPIELFPEIEPYDYGYLDVPGGHSIYYEQCGNKHGRPILYIHGGPGAGCTKFDRRFFNPNKWRIVLFDQRGCGRSRPYKRIEFNNTWSLTQDIPNLLNRLDIEKTAFSGGSWGVALSLLTAILEPHRINGIVLRGVFLGEKEECNYIYGGGAARFAPHYWKRFIGLVPPEKQNDVLNYYCHEMLHSDPERARRMAYEMALFEECLSGDTTLEKAELELKDYPFEALGLLEAYYLVRNCFLKDGYIIDNINFLPKVPITIVQGKFDLVCPPISAYRLAEALAINNRDVDLFMVKAGHSKSEPEIMRVLLRETELMYDKIG